MKPHGNRGTSRRLAERLAQVRERLGFGLGCALLVRPHACYLEAMVWVSGADGCKRGWFRASRETTTGELRFDATAEVGKLLVLAPHPTVVALDIPIGMTDQGPRSCDREARERLGWPRRSSVFPAPVRPALLATTREEASRLTEARDGRRVGAQAWGLYPKIRAVDEWMTSRSDAQERVREVHPEVCFWAWSGERPMKAGKKSRAGKLERLALCEKWLGAGVLETARGRWRKGEVADDDVLDAIAALWTATRIAAGTAVTLPDSPPVDSAGLKMEIVY